jgi:glutamine cyclotransferase
VSDGSDFLFFWDPKTLQEKKRLKIQGWDLKTKGTLSSLDGLNKLEYINGRIWANVISSNIIYEIDLRTGFVTKSLDLSSIVPLENKGSIFSGFAYNNQKDILHVTGKNWPYIIGIRIDF